jgi:hypothetical protein
LDAVKKPVRFTGVGIDVKQADPGDGTVKKIQI